VVALLDGDTFKAYVDLGFGIYFRANVRLLGVNSPELPTLEGIAAAAMLGRFLHIGDVVTITSKRLDLHGRAEALVTLADGRDVGALMLAAGAAVPANDRGNL
jgi:endonuclease YncB( thermonuclease family)